MKFIQCIYRNYTIFVYKVFDDGQNSLNIAVEVEIAKVV